MDVPMMSRSWNMEALYAHNNQRDCKDARHPSSANAEHQQAGTPVETPMHRWGSTLSYSLMNPRPAEPLHLVVQPCSDAFLQVIPYTGETIVSSPFVVTTAEGAMPYYYCQHANAAVNDTSSSLQHQTPLLVDNNNNDTPLHVLTLLFNLALSFHLRGLIHAPTRSGDLEQATLLYQSALRMVQEWQYHDAEDAASANPHTDACSTLLWLQRPTVALLIVAIGNNLCTILGSELYQYTQLLAVVQFCKPYWRCTAPGQARFFARNTLSWGAAAGRPAASA